MEAKYRKSENSYVLYICRKKKVACKLPRKNFVTQRLAITN